MQAFLFAESHLTGLTLTGSQPLYVSSSPYYCSHRTRTYPTTPKLFLARLAQRPCILHILLLAFFLGFVPMRRVLDFHTASPLQDLLPPMSPAYAYMMSSIWAK